MLTLAINTASSHTAIAILEKDKLLAETSWQSQNNEAEKLLPKIAELLENSKKTFQNIKKIIAIKGPGSFTGLRVGVTVANMIAYLSQCELSAIDTFEYWWSANPDADAILIYAGSGGVYVSIPKKEAELVNMPKLYEFLKEKNIQKTVGDITEEQKKALKDIKFTETKETFGKIILKIPKKQLNLEKIIKPYYIKPPSITKPKCSI